MSKEKVKCINNRENEEFLIIGKIYDVQIINGAKCVIDEKEMVKVITDIRFVDVPYVPIERKVLKDILYKKIQMTLNDGVGFAIDRTGTNQAELTSGYAVAMSDDKLTHSNLDELVEDRLDWLIGNEVFINRICGAWIDEGIAYFNKGFNFDDKETALILGKMRNQKAIYDYCNKTVIWIK